MAAAIIQLMQGVVYRESDEDTWITLGPSRRRPSATTSPTIGVDVVVDDTEGYAYLRAGRRSTARSRCRAW